LIDFQIYAAKALAGIGKLPETIADRTIEIRLKRKRADEEAKRFRRREVRDAVEPILLSLASLAEFHVDRLAEARPEPLDVLDDRATDCWEPLFAIADLAGGGWPERARHAALTLSGARTEDDESLGIHLLSDCYEIFNGYERLSTARLLELLCLIEESPWAEKWFDTYKGEPKSGAASNLAWHLRRYGIRSKTLRLESGERLKGYERERFEDGWSRYTPLFAGLSRDSRDNPHEQSDCDPSATRDNTPFVTAQEEASNPHEYSVVTDVTAENGVEENGLPKSEREKAELRDRIARERLAREDAEQRAADERLREEFEDVELDTEPGWLKRALEAEQQ
jgi:hypothetical protein